MRGTTSRRAFFRLSVDEVIASVDEMRGRPSFRLSDLPALDDRDLGTLIPAVADASGVAMDGDRVVLIRSGALPDVLFSAGSRDEEIWARMDGRSTVRDIAAALALEWNQPQDAAFAAVRRLFLMLVARGICLPCNPLP